jgi:hypothetical protein
MSVRIDPETWRALTERAHLSDGRIARAVQRSPQFLSQLIIGAKPVPAELVRDLGLLLAEALDSDPETVRAAVFVEVPDRSRPPRVSRPSYLERRVAERGHPVA